MCAFPVGSVSLITIPAKHSMIVCDGSLDQFIAELYLIDFSLVKKTVELMCICAHYILWFEHFS